MKNRTNFNKSSQLWLAILSACVILAACRSETTNSNPDALAAAVADTATPSATPTEADPPLAATFTLTPTVPPSPTTTPSPTPTPTNTPPPTPTPTPDPYAGVTVADLATRSYGGGQLTILDTMGSTADFTRYLITFTSDELTIYGFMNVPQGEGPFPVALVMHGYINPAQYNTLGYTARYADALARAGYLVIHPNYRNWPPSDEGPDPFRAAHAVDALNLITLIREQAGQLGPLEQADPLFIGMMGHSMGGGITLRTVTVSNAVDAAVLYGSMSGDEKKNFEKILIWSDGERGQEEFNTPDADLERISPIYHLDRIDAAVSIHHGENDGTVPLQWSLDLCEDLQTLGKAVECFTYPGQPHTFYGESDQLFMQRIIEFFDRQKEVSNE